MAPAEQHAAAERLGRILVVDDQPDLADVVSVYFTIAGYEVVSARDGRAALVLADTRPFDVVLLDIMMPGMDGVAVLQQMRLRWPHLPVIMLTAISDLERAKSTLRRGAFDYVSKPFDLDHLHRCVAAALSDRELSVPRGATA